MFVLELLGIFKLQSRGSNVISPMFLSLAFSDFQRFAIIFHLSPSWWREVVGHFKVKPRHCLSVEGFSFRLSVPQMFICEFIFCTDNHFLLNFSVIDVYCRNFGK